MRFACAAGRLKVCKSYNADMHFAIKRKYQSYFSKTIKPTATTTSTYTMQEQLCGICVWSLCLCVATCVLRKRIRACGICGTSARRAVMKCDCRSCLVASKEVCVCVYSCCTPFDNKSASERKEMEISIYVCISVCLTACLLVACTHTKIQLNNVIGS